MKKINITRRLSLFATFLALAVFVMAAPEAEYKKLNKSYTLHADGSQEFRYQMELTLYTHTAMNGTYGESFIVYNPNCQKLKIHESYTRQKDGTIIRTPENAFVEVLPRNAANAPAYNHLKEMVVVHTGLELGATIYLDYSIITQSGALPELDIVESPAQTSPVKDYTLTVNIPADKTLQYSLYGSKLIPKEKEIEKNRTYIWQWKNLPAASKEAKTSIYNGDHLYLTASTFSSPSEALALIYKQLNQDDDPQLSLVAEGIIENIENEEDQLKAILQYVHQEIDNLYLPSAWTQHQFRNADQVINTAYGTELEKANLLCGLLNGAGFSAQILAYYSIAPEEGLALNDISHYYIQCKTDHQDYLFSPVSNQRPVITAIHPNTFLRLSDGQPEQVKLTNDYTISAQIKIQFKEGKPTAELKQKTGNGLLPYFVSGTKTSSTSVLWNTTGDYATLELKDPYEGISHIGYGRWNSQRVKTLQMDYPIEENYTFTIDCPKNYQLKTASGVKSIHNKVGTFSYTITPKAGTITVCRSLKIVKTTIQPSEYKDFRALVTEWDALDNHTLIFKKE